MNEIELLGGLRAELPPPRPEARAAARARLLAEAGLAGTAVATPLWRAPRLRLALAALALAAIVLIVPIGVFGGGGGAQSALGRALDDAARAAAVREPQYPGPGQFLYTRSRDAYLRSTAYSPRCVAHPCDLKHPSEATREWSVLVPSTREVWASFDGSRRGRVRQVNGRPRFLSPAQRAGWIAAGSPPLPRAGQVEDSPLVSGGFIDTTGLPTDPAALRKLLEAREIPGVEGPPGEAETFSLIGEMLRGTYLPAEIRAAVYRLTGELPGVKLLGRVRDPAGRWGTGVSYTDRRWGVRHELIFDPSSSELLGERDTTVRRGVAGIDAPPGTAIGYAVYLESKIVSSVGPEAPAGAGAPNRSIGCYDRASLHADTTILQGKDPLATCARLWREGVVDSGSHSVPAHLVACASAQEGGTTLVFPGSGPAVCARLGLESK